MNRRDFIKGLAAAGVTVLMPALAQAANYERLLILVELKGGNDGLNTLVPYADPNYATLRPRIGLRRDEILPLNERLGFHPSLQTLLPLWQNRELALVQGVGYPAPNLSHFRSIEILDTASKSDEYLAEGWLARAFLAVPPAPTFAAEGVIVGSQDMGPLSGGRRVVALSNPEQFARQARLATAGESAKGGALAHIQRVESGIRQTAGRLSSAGTSLRTEFPAGAFGNMVRTAAQVLASGASVAVLRLTLNGFDTHQNQTGVHANLLKQLAEGLTALRAALIELGRWQDSLILSYAEFGRRPKENQSGGTDHGTANVHFVLGGRIRGGLYGAAPDLTRLDGNGNLAYGVDFRSLYATVLERWWQVDSNISREALRGRFPLLDFLA